MSSALPSDPSGSRTWWSLSPKHHQDIPAEYSQDKPSRPSSFNSFVAALGFKSKKHGGLASKEPTSRPFPPSIDTKVTSRPTSKSASSTRSRVDSFGPRTPVDGQREGRHSLLTLSDADPFAVRALSSAPHTPDPNRLSAYSNSSIPDFMTKNAEPIINRASYASSSSHSNLHGSELSPVSPSLSAPKKPKPKKSTASLSRKHSAAAADHSLGSAWASLTLSDKSKSASSATLTEKNRLSQPEPSPPRPPMRARGMTDSGGQRSGFLSNNAGSSTSVAPPSSVSSHSPPISPRVIIRQPSVPRIGLPTSAPPRQKLPPPPPVFDHRLRDEDEMIVPPSSSSSSLSFASSVSSNREIMSTKSYSSRQRTNPLGRSLSTKLDADTYEVLEGKGSQPSSAHRTLKKAISYQSLGRRTHASTAPPPAPPPQPPLPTKPLRKQRSFHHPKVSVPTTAASIHPTSSNGSYLASPPANSQSAVEQRRGSAGVISLPGRKRLFSGSTKQRPSTTQCVFSDDDAQSVFSVRSDNDQTGSSSIFKSMGQQISPVATSSFWDEGTHDHMPSSPQQMAYEYTPQQIMSPAEMARLESGLDEPIAPGRGRRLSLLSTSTIATSEREDDYGPFPEPPDLSTGSINRLVSRSTSLVSMNKGLGVPPRHTLRPSNSSGAVPLSSANDPKPLKPFSNIPSVTSLPPPPRRGRPRPAFVPDDAGVIPPLPTLPVRKHTRPTISVQKALHRQSIMRKPSFLEIDDDTDGKDSDYGSYHGPPSGSFLDLDRESFDTVRSIEE
ncbi:hypothetical protein H0H81_007448 [Sphagnurus paluster]|uniref:Uncharacterized protein n=1 Tax=Sphagnurus paluster TaxID=117069 RepID=A0A9P7GPY6_9AGAR|nr:hypothetical protein H0H81_007448 [Sphagnurus paluster]